MAINDGYNIYNYPPEVIFQVSDTDISEYLELAKKINSQDEIKLLNIQHEFGIFGGEWGCYLIPFLEMIKKPVVITFHTVLPKPDKKLKRTVRNLADKSSCIVVMTKKAIEILKNDYGLTGSIRLIHHGIPTVNLENCDLEKERLGYSQRTLLISFGMMNSSKGYEYVIESLPEVIKKYPDLLYIIVGETHPVVRRHEGEQYRNMLVNKVNELGLQWHVKFYNKYVTLEEIVQYLQAADIYICANQNPNQITSGTLVYSMGAGCPVISTPFLYAQDMLSAGRGLLVKFSDSDSIKNALLELLSNQELTETISEHAYAYTRQMTWPNIARKYNELFSEYISPGIPHPLKLPKIKMDHLARLTDNFGIIQFAKRIFPDISSGYTVDDNVRAIIVCYLHYEIFKDQQDLDKLNIYLNFLEKAQLKDGWFNDFWDEHRKVTRERCSDDCFGRVLWSMGTINCCKVLPKEFRDRTKSLLKKSISSLDQVKSPRAVAYIIIGLENYLRCEKNASLLKKIKNFADHLVSIFHDNKTTDWFWFENYLTYANSRLPESLLRVYKVTGEKEYLKIGLKTLDFLIGLTFEKGHFSPIGHDGWYTKDGHRAFYDQQPVDAAAMVQTLILAYQITKEKRYHDQAMIAFDWFLGNNELKQQIYDEQSGGCHDGLGEFTVNLNQGAESTLSYLMARLTLESELTHSQAAPDIIETLNKYE